MPARTDWSKELRPLLDRYKDKKHPLHYHSIYQLLVMVVLSAQTSDDAINATAPGLFKAYPGMAKLAKAKPEDLFPYLKGIRNFANKAKWLTGIAYSIRDDKSIPLRLDALTRLSGIGRKSANVILREAHQPAEGIIVDLHVIRVAGRLGITKEEDPKKIEEELMKLLPHPEWDAGMAMSFLGREICHPKPECPICPMKEVCAYYKKVFIKATLGKPAATKPKPTATKPKPTATNPKPAATKPKPAASSKRRPSIANSKPTKKREKDPRK